MRLVRLLALAGLAGACSLGVPLPPGEVEEIARDLLRVGHPAASYEASRLARISKGTGGNAPSVDVEVDYVGALGKKTRTMTVRLEVLSTDPCRVRSNVVGDTGRNPPVLLDNAVAAPLVGRRVCSLFD